MNPNLEMKTNNILCVAGFGDNSSMFDQLTRTDWPQSISFAAIDLPGFGSPRLSSGTTSLDQLAQIVVDEANRNGTDIVLAHSVASIIASKAAARKDSPIKYILSLEGNLTAEDAFFSGTAAQFDSPQAFGRAFLDRLDKMAENEAMIRRYRDVVKGANPQALWELGCDAHRFSATHIPGEILLRSARSVYLCNPENVPKSSLEWLNTSPLPVIELPGASHWASIDQPRLLVEKLVDGISLIGR